MPIASSSAEEYPGATRGAHRCSPTVSTRVLWRTPPVGWEALEQWGDDVARIEPLAGGVANDVWSVRVYGHLAVGRLGARSDADLAWETKLLPLNLSEFVVDCRWLTWA